MLHLAHHLQDKSHIIWDWNGTILDDVEICIAIISEVLVEHGLSPISISEYRSKFHFPIHSYYQSIGLNPERVEFAYVTKRFIKAYEERLPGASLYRGAREVLELLSNMGKTQSVLSAAHEHDLRRLLASHGLDKYFTQVSGLTNHDADSKVGRGLQHIKALNIPREDIILIGDTDHDLEVAEALGIDAILLDNGHQCGDHLRKKHHRVFPRSQNI